MTPPPIPLVILGGSDLVPSRLPATAAASHALSGYKGVDLRIDGRPLIALILERVRALGRFGPILLAGPAAHYRAAATDVQLVDTDASVAVNVRTALSAVRERGLRGPVAFLSCDVLLDAAEVAPVLAAWPEHDPPPLWFPLVRVPEDHDRLGSFGWKPEYPLRPAPGSAPLRVLPGHLAILDPDALRIDLILRLVDLTYATRNRSIRTRRRVFLARMLGTLLWWDVRRLLHLEPPTLTLTVVGHGLRIARRFGAADLSLPDLERSLTLIAVHRRHRKRRGARGVSLPIVDALTLAEDIDTQEEAAQLDATWTTRRRAEGTEDADA